MTDNKTGAALSPQFIDALKVMQDIIPSKVNEKLIQGAEKGTLDVSKMYFITPSPDLTKLVFVKFGKPILTEDGTPNTKGMGDGKLVRVLRSLLSAELASKDLLDRDFEAFHNIYTSFFSTEDGEVVIWSGKLIDDAYHERNYYTGENPDLYCCNCDYTEDECECEPEDQELVPTDDIERGTLWESCMRHNSCIEDNFFQVYKDHAKIAVLLCNNKVRARALIWTTEEGITFMDRIYATEDRLIQKMIAFARLNKWDYKEEQSYNNKTGFYHYDVKLGSYRKAYWTHRIQLDKDSLINSINMPYVDTLTYLYIDSKTNEPYLINNCSKIQNARFTDLTSTGGNWERGSYIKSCRCGEETFIRDRCSCDDSKPSVSIATEAFRDNTSIFRTTADRSLDFNLTEIESLWEDVDEPEEEVSEETGTIQLDDTVETFSLPLRREFYSWDIETVATPQPVRSFSEWHASGLSEDTMQYIRSYIQSTTPVVDSEEVQTEQSQEETSDF